MRIQSAAFLALVVRSVLACSTEDPASAAGSGASKVSSQLSLTSVTQAGDERRSGWYPNQPLLAPATVKGASFGKLFSTPISGQVYAQPLVSGDVLFVATETNDIYGLDTESGVILWHRSLGTPWNPADVGCNDLLPSVGVTGTPVIDLATNTAYLVAKTYASGSTGPAEVWMHGVDVASGVEKGGFPVRIQGTASNDATRAFNATNESQRPGLLLSDGAIYAAFGAHCDHGPWAGWVASVTTAGALRTLWTASVGGNNASGAGIWQSGGGLVSDGAGQILFATGNGGAPKGTISGKTPPKQLGESIVRLSAQSDGSLKATDFFAPLDAAALDGWDADLASGSPIALPTEAFGSGLYPHLLAVAGKQGYLYLLDLDNLGGIGNGASGADLVVNRIGPYGGVWSAPAVWPGDGGYLYIPTASGGNASAGSAGVLRGYRYGLDGQGKPTLSLAGSSSEAFGFSSSHPVVTSNGTASGTALLWIVWSPNGSGVGAQLRAYDPIPDASGNFTLVFSAPIGRSAKFTPPGVGAGRIYVGTRDGTILGFGATVPAPLSAPPIDFGKVIVGQTKQSDAVFTATAPVTVRQLVAAQGDFKLGAPNPPLPATLAPGAQLTVPVTFAPTSSGLKAGGTEAIADNGRASVSFAGRGQSSGAELTAYPPAVSFGATTVGGHLVGSVTFSNAGASPLTINTVTAPTSPFVGTGLPEPNSVIPADGSVTLTVEFAPTAVGNYLGGIALNTSAGVLNVPLSGRCALAGKMALTPKRLQFPPLAVGASRLAEFSVKNSGGTDISIAKSKPPGMGAFYAETSLDEGTQLPPQAVEVEQVTFKPRVAGVFSDGWTLTATDGLGIQSVELSGSSISGRCRPDGSDFVLNGAAAQHGTELVLTPTSQTDLASTAFCPHSVSAATLDVTFDFSMAGGTGGDGMTLVLADASRVSTDAVGAAAGGLGISGVPSYVVAFDTVRNVGDPSANFVGVFQSKSSSGQTITWLSTNTSVPALRSAAHRAHVFSDGGELAVELDDAEVLRVALNLPSDVLVGFSASTGTLTDRHVVSNISLLDLADLNSATAGAGGASEAGAPSDAGAAPIAEGGSPNAGAEAGGRNGGASGRGTTSGDSGASDGGGAGSAGGSSGCSCGMAPRTFGSGLTTALTLLGLAIARRARRNRRHSQARLASP